MLVYAYVRRKSTPRERGKRCSRMQADSLAKRKPHTYQHTSCPHNEAWHKALLNHSEQQRQASLVTIGCSRGDDLIASMRR